MLSKNEKTFARIVVLPCVSIMVITISIAICLQLPSKQNVYEKIESVMNDYISQHHPNAYYIPLRTEIDTLYEYTPEVKNTVSSAAILDLEIGDMMENNQDVTQTYIAQYEQAINELHRILSRYNDINDVRTQNGWIVTQTYQYKLTYTNEKPNMVTERFTLSNDFSNITYKDEKTILYYQWCDNIIESYYNKKKLIIN